MARAGSWSRFFLAIALGTTVGCDRTSSEAGGSAPRASGSQRISLAGVGRHKTRDPAAARAHFDRARELAREERDEEATKEFNEAILLDDRVGAYYLGRGRLRAFARQEAAAQRDFAAAVERDPDDAEAHYELGLSKAREHDVAGAESAQKKALGLDPKMAKAAFSLGLLAQDRGELDEAVRYWQRAVAIDPKHAGAHYNLGTYYQAHGDPAKELAHFLAAHEAEPRAMDSLEKLIQAYHRLSRHDEAARHRAELLEVIRTSSDPKVRATKEFCFDEFADGADVFYAYETLATKPGDPVVPFVFRLVRDGRGVKSIQVEAGEGVPYSLGQTEGGTHTTLVARMRTIPPYPELKQMVLDSHHGTLAPTR